MGVKKGHFTKLERKELRRLSGLAYERELARALHASYGVFITNFEIGRRIVDHEQQGSERAEYGKALLNELSGKLGKEFGRGFSRSNLEYMRKFYLVYQNRLGQISQMSSGKLLQNQKSQTASGKYKDVQASGISQTPSAKSGKSAFSLSWSQYVFLIGITDEDARSFYEIEAAENNWILPELVRQFNSGLYERELATALESFEEKISAMEQK